MNDLFDDVSHSSSNSNSERREGGEADDNISFSLTHLSGSDKNLCYAYNDFLQQLYNSSLPLKQSYAALPAQKLILTFDSASNIHYWKLADARKFFKSRKSSTLTVVGVSATPEKASFEGDLDLTVLDEHGNKFKLKGRAFASSTLPVNLLSVSVLIGEGAVIHFESGNNWFKPTPTSPRIPLTLRNGLFEMSVHIDPCSGKTNNTLPEQSIPPDDSVCYSVNGRVYGLSADLQTWHQRLNHINIDKLKRIQRDNLVHGFSVKRGGGDRVCHCDICSMAKLRRPPTPQHSPYSLPLKHIGQRVSCDTKEVPFKSLRGYRYVLVFVDHYSRLEFCYLMRSKSETTDALERYISEMKHLGLTVHCIQSDRGTEFFEQESETTVDRDRSLHSFRAVCKRHGIKHVVTPVEIKEKLAEIWNRDMFRAVSAMLWQARLSPVFWADAVRYNNFVRNRIPNDHLGGQFSPWTLATGETPRWDKFRVFGCDVYEHIPNNKFNKIPGIPRGRKLIFVGFEPGAMGWKVFDPETRRYFSSTNLYFYENFSHRIDALRQHDARRALLKKGKDQPLILDDFAAVTSQQLDSVRNLYMDPSCKLRPVFDPEDDEFEFPTPSATPPSLPASSIASSQQLASGGGRALDAHSISSHSSQTSPIAGSAEDSASASAPKTQPQLSMDREARARRAIHNAQMLRPLRLTAVGIPVKATQEDKDFLRFFEINQIPCVWLKPCPKQITTASGKRYMKYMSATTFQQAIELGASRDDIRWDYERGFISLPKHESDLPGHIFNCLEVAEQHGHTHALEDYGTYVSKSDEVDYKLSQVFATLIAKDQRRNQFNEMMATSFENEEMLKLFEDRERSLKFAEYQAAKLLNNNSHPDRRVEFSISPEPKSFDEVQPEVCAEADRWKEAMDEEIYSMNKFGVFTAVPKSEARGRQILGTRWVYKRKMQNGKVVRYRARLVAQGYRQKAYDSFDPDDISLPVVHRESLRTFLSVSAALNLRVYQCDIKAAFLQAPLSEEIYIKTPPGYSSQTSSGEEEVWRLKKAIYGLKQSSCAFWNAMSSHLIDKGFVSILGDPCLFRRILPNGKIILVATYVDDITFSVTDSETRDFFMRELRERFEIGEDEGKPIE